MKRISAVIVWLCLLLSGPVHGAPATPQCTNLAGTTGDPGTGCAGNPINLTTGNKFQREVDMPALPGVLGLELVRYYNSDFSGPRIPNGLLGRGWKLSYETELYVAGKTLQIVLADGTHLSFSRDPLDPSRCSTGNPAHGTIAIRRASRGNDYLWTHPDGRQLTFTSRGRLAMIRVPGGQFVSMTHDDDGLLQTVTDPQGRQLRLGYLDRQAVRKNGHRFRGVQTITSPVGTFAYAYGSALPAGSTVDPAITLANLAGVTGPDSQRGYDYEDPRQPTLLTGIRIGNERVATYAYNADGKAILSTHAGDVDKVTLDYRSSTETVLTNSLGQVTTYRHAVVGDRHQVLEVRGPGCRLCSEGNVRYAYNALGQLTETTRLNVAGQPLSGVRLTLDYLGRTLVIDRISYLNGQPQPAQRQARFRYHSDTAFGPTLVARPSVVPGQEVVTQIGYNAAGQPLDVTEHGWEPASEPGAPATAISRTTRTGYTTINGRSLPTTIDGPLANGPTGTPADSDITQLRYDARGDFLVETIAPGNRRTTTRQRTDAGLASSVEQGDGVHPARRIDTTYNAHGQPVRVVQGALVTTLAYDARQRLQRLTRPDGTWLQTTYDAGGRIAGQQDQNGNAVRRAYDSESQLLAATLHQAGLDATTRYEYDDQRHLIRSTAATDAVTRYRYDGAGQLVGLTDALERQTAYRYDPSGQLAAIVQNADIDAGAALTRLADPANTGQADTLIAANGATNRHQRDDFGRLVTVNNPDSGRQTARYDGADRVILTVDANGNQTRSRYDVAGQLIERISSGRDSAGFAQTERVRYIYRGARLVGIRHPGQETDFVHDDDGRVIEQTDRIAAVDGRHATFSFTRRTNYDALGRVSTRTLPSGEQLVVSYGASGQPTRLDLLSADGRTSRPIATGIVLQPFTGLAGFTHGNGLATSYRHDRRSGQLTALATSAAGAVALQTQQLAYDIAGRLTTITRNGQPEHYGYDRNDHLARVDTPTEQARWTVDAVGNRLSTPSQSLVYQPASNRLHAITSAGTTVAYDYDPAGHPLRIGTRKDVYGVTGRLQQVSEGDRLVARYAYNAHGERIAKTVFDASGRATTTYFLYQGQQLDTEIDGQGRVVAHYLYGAHVPLAKLDYPAPDPRAGWWRTALDRIKGALHIGTDPRASRIYALHTDHLGTPHSATDAQQRVVWRAGYTAFGKATVKNAAITLNLRLPGQYFDSETGGHYNVFRDYLPELGRYLQSDPIGIGAGVNTYAYAGGNPLSNVDPVGLDFLEKLEAIGAVGIFNARKANEMAEIATREAQQSNLPGLHNGPADAYRHCVWSCLMSQNFGVKGAKDIADQHEDAGDRNGQPRDERVMDESNNSIGRSCGLLNDKRTCPQRCIDVYWEGGLSGLNGIFIKP